MKVLHYAALEHPKVAMALQGQAWESLKPFRAFLQAAIRAAKQRQILYRVGWKPAEIPRHLRLKVCDSILELLPQDSQFRVTGLPERIDPETLPPKLIINWTSFVDIRRVQREGTELRISLDQAPDEGAEVAWAGHPVCIERVSHVSAPREVFDAAGRALDIVAVQQKGDRVRLVVAKEAISSLHSRSGLPIPCRSLSWKEDLSEIRGTEGGPLPFTESLEVQVAKLPSTSLLHGDNGVRFSWQEIQPRGRRVRGEWVQLLSVANDAELAIDPRAAFCEEGVREVRFDGKRALRVLGYRRESWQLLLEALPPENAVLQLPINLNNLYRQQEAIDQLSTGPLAHHRGLLRLLEDPSRTQWPSVRPAPVTQWFLLKPPESGQRTWDGTQEQQEFVRKALATPDFVFLEGPPGSGKTHAICELILQLIEQGKRILLCSTTHVAVDNVLERLVGRYPQVEALRIGAFDRVDERIRACQIDERVETLCEQWQQSPQFLEVHSETVRAMAEQVVLASANLTCGTTTGILAHPYLRTSRDSRSSHQGHAPHFDVLILDEASKTTFQEFLVPALLARRWVVVGDVAQLPPFSERQDLEASLEDLTDEVQQGKRRQMSRMHQRACFLFFRLNDYAALPGRLRWLVSEPTEVLECLRDELLARAGDSDSDSMEDREMEDREMEDLEMEDLEVDELCERKTESSVKDGPRPPSVVRIVASPCRVSLTPQQQEVYREVSASALEKGESDALHLLAADWILLEDTLLKRCERWLPADLCSTNSLSLELDAWKFRRNAWLARRGTLEREVRERGAAFKQVADLEMHQQRFLKERSWPSEVGWRLSRTHQLHPSKSAKERTKLEKTLEALSPHRRPESQWAPSAILDIRDVGLRSMLESLRLGRTDHRVRRTSTLTEGMPGPDWKARAVKLSFQHRMHPEISAFPRDCFYDGNALKDANTLEGRDAQVGWTFGRHYPARRTWIDVDGSEGGGVNREEIQAMRRVLENWKKERPAPRRTTREGELERPWELACLAFYHKQELAIRDMLREVTGQPRRETRFELPHTEIVCGTVDRFQGREADMVLMSLRNTRRVGHLDSPNRLNVGITRARHLLLVFGKRPFFADCDIEELEQLAKATPCLAKEARR